MHIRNRRWHLSPLLLRPSKRLTRPLSLTGTATGFSKTFPGIVPHLLTLTSNFRVPFYRDIILAMGICSVSKESCSNILKGGPGQSITIVVGGAAESLSAHPGTADLTLRKRWVWLVSFLFEFNLCLWRGSVGSGWQGGIVGKGSELCSRWLIGILHPSFRLGFIKVAIQHGCVSANLWIVIFRLGTY